MKYAALSPGGFDVTDNSEDVFDPRCAVVYLSIGKDKGEIKAFSSAFPLIFGYEREEIFGKSVNLLIPQAIAKTHDQLLQNFVDKGRCTLIRPQHFVFMGLNKKKFIVPVRIQGKVDTYLEDELSMAGFITPIQSQSCYILTDYPGNILHTSERLHQDMGLIALKSTKRALRNVVALIPKISQYFLASDETAYQQNKLFMDFSGLVMTMFVPEPMGRVNSSGTAGMSSLITESDCTPKAFSGSRKALPDKFGSAVGILDYDSCRKWEITCTLHTHFYDEGRIRLRIVEIVSYREIKDIGDYGFGRSYSGVGVHVSYPVIDEFCRPQGRDSDTQTELFQSGETTI
jgi:hypothetical protein